MIKFRKVHGSGNDFILIADTRVTQDWSALAKRLCQRHTGIGADGLIMSERRGASEYTVRCYNPDGSVATMCGNGLRCAARCAADDHGDTRMTLVMEGIAHRAVIDGTQVSVTAEVGAVTNGSVEMTWHGQLLSFSSVNTGTEHAVALVDSISRLNLAEVGRVVRYHPALAPAGANVSIARALKPHLLKIRTYERGVEAETLSCGSGAVAAVVIARLAGVISSGPVTVLNQADSALVVDCPDNPCDQTAWLTGSAKVVYRGEMA